MSPADPRHQPVAIEVDRDAGVSVEFLDGTTARFDLVELRRACPCAGCRAQRDRREPVWPGPRAPEPLEVTDASLHGGWGLAITWNDGHRTGIYPFDALRRWHDGGPAYPPDSGLGGSGPGSGR